MRRWAGFLALTFLTLVAGGRAWGDDAYQREFDHVTRTILCDCGCSPQSVHDCACGRAAEMRNEIAAAIRGGKTGAQVVDGYVARHGEKIRVCPTASGFNLLAWLGPGVVFFVGVAASLVILRRWKQTSAARDGHAPGPTPAADDPYVARLREHLKEYE